MDAPSPQVVLAGRNPTEIWGMSVDERVRRIARAQKLSLGIGEALPVLVVNRAFVFDPSWLRYFAGRPGEALTLGGQVAIAHCRSFEELRKVEEAIEGGSVLPPSAGLRLVPHEQGGTRVNSELRKREQPFLMPLQPDTVRAAERASYFGAYKGVTDLLTKYLWPEWALVLTRLAARAGISPNMVTGVGAACCILAMVLFWRGHYWTGMATGLVFMVLDTVDGKLARCTITSSKWGNVFDHGIDLVHPPFWWYAWGIGLAAYGRPIAADELRFLLVLIIGGYVVQRVIEGAFMRLYGMHIHVWRKFDSDFRLVTARRNPNMVILFACMLFARPDLGLVAIAWWTVLSCLVHLVRLLQAMLLRARGGEIRSWLG